MRKLSDRLGLAQRVYPKRTPDARVIITTKSLTIEDNNNKFYITMDKECSDAQHILKLVSQN